MNHRIYLLMTLIIFVSSCKIYHNSYYPQYPRIRAEPVKQEGQVFFPDVHLPSEDFIEMGTFTLNSKQVPYGRLFNYLPRHLSKQGFDGAIILDKQIYYDTHHRRVSANDAGPVGNLLVALAGNDDDQEKQTTVVTERRKVDEITYMGIVYVSNLNRLEGSLKSIIIQQERKDSILTSAEVFFDTKGKITEVEGDVDLYREARLIQPWFFLDQMGGSWRYYYKKGDKYPDRILNDGQDFYKYYYSDRNPEWPYFRRTGEFGRDKTFLYLHPDSEQPLVSRVVVKDKVEVVFPVFENDRLKQQLWQRNSEGVNYRYIYNYRSLDDIPEDWIIKPRNLVRSKFMR
ncbi:MAG: hypothetical protein ACPF9D_07060 [Owenweeksia sp.]